MYLVAYFEKVFPAGYCNALSRSEWHKPPSRARELLSVTKQKSHSRADAGEGDESHTKVGVIPKLDLLIRHTYRQNP